ncbi:MAG TPA: DUF1801 domain-containing protein [Hyphomicrobium sp.]|jgi:uncharacterized protein YdhG (YjbR/CyaY superfamily)
MSKNEAVDAYLAMQPAGTRRVLEKVRATLRKALPGAEEVISYKIPAYRLAGGIVIYLPGGSRTTHSTPSPRRSSLPSRTSWRPMS